MTIFKMHGIAEIHGEDAFGAQGLLVLVARSRPIDALVQELAAADVIVQEKALIAILTSEDVKALAADTDIASGLERLPADDPAPRIAAGITF